MKYFREMKLQTILLFNLVAGLVTGWFMHQAIRLILGQWIMTGIFWRFLGVQYAFFLFIVVYYANMKLWQKKRTRMPDARDGFLCTLKLLATILVYAVGAVAVNLVIGLF